MDRRVFIGFLAGGVLAGGSRVEAQTPTAPGRRILPSASTVGILSENAANATCKGPVVEDALSKRIFLGGERPRTIPDCLAGDVLERAVKSAGHGTRINMVERGGPALEELVRELIRARAEIVVSLGTPASLAAKRVTDSIPIVMAGVTDPVGLGLVASLAKPGGNITGVSFLGPEVAGKSLDLLVQIAPSVRRLAVLWNPLNPGAAFVLNGLKAVRPKGIELSPVEIGLFSQMPRVFEQLKAQKSDALMVLEDVAFAMSAAEIIAFAEHEKLPTVFHLKKYTSMGGLMAYGPNEVEIYERAANYVSRILGGARPADLPVEQPTKIEFVINLKTAKALGLTISQSLLQRADQVIE